MSPKASFLAGAVFGLILAIAGSAVGALVVGDDGFLFGWTVSINGQDVCHDPFVWRATREIECD